MASPTVEPDPNTTLITPLGKPAASKIFANSWAMMGVSVAGFHTTAFPATIAGDDLHVAMAIGKFHGVMSRTTPVGARILIANLLFSSAGVVCPNNRRPSPAI